MDSYLYQKSSSSEDHLEDCISKQVLWAQDSNSGNFNGWRQYGRSCL